MFGIRRDGWCGVFDVKRGLLLFRLPGCIGRLIVRAQPADRALLFFLRALGVERDEAGEQGLARGFVERTFGEGGREIAPAVFGGYARID